MGRKNNGAAAAIAGVSFRSGKESRAIKIRAAHGIFAKNAALRPENAGGVLNIIIKPTVHLCTVGFVYWMRLYIEYAILRRIFKITWRAHLQDCRDCNLALFLF